MSDGSVLGWRGARTQCFRCGARSVEMRCGQRLRHRRPNGARHPPPSRQADGTTPDRARLGPPRIRVRSHARSAQPRGFGLVNIRVRASFTAQAASADSTRQFSSTAFGSAYAEAKKSTTNEAAVGEPSVRRYRHSTRRRHRERHRRRARRTQNSGCVGASRLAR